MKELKEGMVVRCVSEDLDYYEYGEDYIVGYDGSGDFGVVDGAGHVDYGGIYKGSGSWKERKDFSWGNFVLVSELEEESDFTMVEVPHYKGEPLVKVSQSGKYEMFKYQSGASGIIIRNSDGEVLEFNGVTALEF